MFILYDDKCKFCTHFSSWCKNSNKKIITHSVRSKEAKEMLRGLGIKIIDLQSIYYIKNNKVYKKSTAIFYIFKELHFPWKIISVFRVLPIPLTDFFYKIFAKYRYKF